MRATVMDGTRLAESIKEMLTEKVAALRERKVKPCLATILAGDNISSHKYVDLKRKDCAKVGIDSRKYEFPESVSGEDIIATIEELNKDLSVHGILLQLPLPSHINPYRVIESISPNKDVDGLHPYNMGRLLVGDYGFETSLLPCTPKGIMRLLLHYKVEMKGKCAVIINRSNLVGKPLYKLLLDRDTSLITCHSKTRDIFIYTRMADILVSAVGQRPTFSITEDMVKEGAVVVDAGISHLEGRFQGDVHFDEVLEKASFITPMPGGVGPMTRAILLENTVRAAKNQTGL